MTTFIKPFSVLAATPALLLLLSSQLLAQKTETKPIPAKWIVTCSNQATPDKLVCLMTQVVFQKKTRQRIMSVTILKSEAGVLMARLQMPHGLDITKGVNLSVDKGVPTNHPIQTSNANGAFTTLPLSSQLLDSMKAGKLLSVAVSGTKGRALNIQLTLDGFAKSYDLMK